MTKNKVLAVVLATVLLVSAAVAATLSQVTSDAQALKTDYQTLLSRMDACPDAQCSYAAEISPEHDGVQARLDQLHSDRASLGSGSYASLDNLIHDIDVMEAQTKGTIGPFDMIP
jgi:hypothetical protein